MDVEREVLLKRIKVLNAKLDLAIKQRNNFMESYHHIMRVPFAERADVMQSRDEDLDKLNETTE